MARGKEKVNKAEFIRGLPDAISYADAAVRGKQAGLDISKAYFYVVRSDANKSAGGAEPKTSTTSEPKNKRVREVGQVTTDGGDKSLMLTSSNPDENAILGLARKLGVGRVEGLLTKLKKFELE